MTKDKNISELDLKIWKDYIKNPKDLIDKDFGKKVSFTKNRFKLDLHGYTLVEANKKIEEIINYCYGKNYNEILLITGKGLHSNTDNDVYASKKLSKLKYSVPEFIKKNDYLSKLVHSIIPADKKDGGEGAVIVKLKKDL